MCVSVCVRACVCVLRRKQEVIKVNMVLNVHRNHKRHAEQGERGEEGMEVEEEGDDMPITTLSGQNYSCIKIGSDKSHFNVSLTVRDKVTRQCPQTATLLKRKESRSGIEPRSFCLPA